MKTIFRILLLTATLLCSALLESALAEQVDLRPQQTEVKNQKNRDTCAYFAVSALVESTLKGFNGKEYDISEEFEVFRNKIIYSWRPEVEFGNTYEVLQNMIKDGYVYSELSLPYQEKSIDFTKPLSAGDEAFFDLRKQKISRTSFFSMKFKQLTQMWVRKPWSLQALDELKQKRSVVVTLKVALPYVDDKKGTFRMSPEIDAECASGKISCGGHAVLLVGYDSEKKVFLFKNSWGNEWGNQGYGYVTFDHVDNYSDQLLTAYFDKMSYPIVRESVQ
ncbi:C1 family peptidase [Bdellovibrio svalbardensis]|uniref:C1 family peptidase n=1 Tax=Bdellovibrio svalbardensis TaxID=2972972 RepID=A0ABT6DP32_9BACT|nr:C1 family peptidase [Bdellovibrio svalbardensis]MDG0817591.1 C1 family peptidase [Bdellovibrio svalbardensis]